LVVSVNRAAHRHFRAGGLQAAGEGRPTKTAVIATINIKLRVLRMGFPPCGVRLAGIGAGAVKHRRAWGADAIDVMALRGRPG